MTTTPQMFDRAMHEQRRSRVDKSALFLHDSAIDDVQDRLSMVNRTFKRMAIVTPFADLWRQHFPDADFVADTETLSFLRSDYDVVVHAMCLHWSNDPVGQLIQCRLAMQSDGFFLCLMLGGATLEELRACLGQAEAVVTGGLSPRIAPMGELRDLGGLLQRAGLALPVADSQVLSVSYRDIFHLMHDLRAMGETNILANRLRRPTRRALFDRANDLYQNAYSNDHGRIKATFEVITLTGWSPSQSQPKPLRPGSAQTTLAQALGTNEIKLPD